jgi:hypothetical protein
MAWVLGAVNKVGRVVIGHRACGLPSVVIARHKAARSAAGSNRSRGSPQQGRTKLCVAHDTRSTPKAMLNVASTAPGSNTHTILMYTRGWLHIINFLLGPWPAPHSGACNAITTDHLPSYALGRGRGGVYRQRLPSALLLRHTCYIAPITRGQPCETVVGNH